MRPVVTLWDRLCIHACYQLWNPIRLILNDDWVAEVWRLNGLVYPGWRSTDERR